MIAVNWGYPCDLTDEEWALAEPLIPPAKPGGNRRRVNVREVVNAIMYILTTGCQWRAIPKDLPPRNTVHDLDLWSYDGTLDRIHHALYMQCRELPPIAEEEGLALKGGTAINLFIRKRAAPVGGYRSHLRAYTAAPGILGRHRRSIRAHHRSH